MMPSCAGRWTLELTRTLYTAALPTYKPLPERRKRELDGGILIVGRPTFTEFMAGLKKGRTSGLDEVDQDEVGVGWLL